MKRFFLTLLIVAGCAVAEAQSSTIEFYKDSLNKTNVDSNKAYCLYILSYYYQNYQPDSALILAQAAHSLSVKSHFLRGEIGSLGQIALAFNKLGNFSKALENYLVQLKLIEGTKDPEDIASAYLSIALVYNSQKDLENALYYASKADSIAVSIADKKPELRLYTTLDMGEIYSNNNRLDSASRYTAICYDESIRLKNKIENDTALTASGKSGVLAQIFSCAGTALNNMGNIHLRGGYYDSALYYFRSSIPYVDSMQDYNTLAECYYGMAQSFDKKAMYDSALFYAERSFSLASTNKFLKHSMNASYLLSQLYKRQNNIDSAFAFQQTYIELKDSFDNAEKIKQLQSLTINEQMRQRELVQLRAEQAKERRLQLELLLVGMFIPILFLITALISGKKVNRRIIKFSGIFSLLFLFEYITLLLHPWVMEKTGHSPFFEIVIFVAIAAIISPTHHRIEAWLINKLSIRHQNRMNRILAAKAAAEAARVAEKEAKDAAEAAKAASKI